ncbi:MAG: right-handed parallel beta-helix repeat-containing protein, partial [Saprospiraceae bacterium]
MNYYPSNTNGANGKNEYRIIKCFNSYNPYLHIGLFFLLFIGLNFSVFATELVSTRDINFKPYSAFDFRKNESFNKNNFHNSKISEKIAPFMVGAVHNVTQNLFYVLLQDAVNAANVNDVIELNGNITEALVNINKSITLNGNSFYLLSTSPNFGIEISATNINLLNLEIRSAGTFGIQTDCGADFLNLNNIFVNNCGGTGISIYGVDNAVLTNITSQDNGGNGINFTNCDNTTVNGLTTSGNNFPGGFEAGIGIFTSSIYCLPGGINGLTINGPISIAESTKAYSQKADASHIITGLSSNTTLFDWAVGIGALDRNYWPSKVVAYTVVDALFEAPYNYPNSVIYVVQVATEDFYVDDNPAGDPTPPMLISTAINFLIPGNIINIEDGSYNERLTVDKSLTLNGTSELGTILEGTGLIGNGSGILLNVGITNVSIQNLSIQNYNGNSPNAYAGIYGTGGNNSLTVNNCTIKNNIGGSGFYANGPVIGILLNNLDISGHTNAFGAARGIVIWNGFKQNITITNCDVYNNNCCGIELQDGTASGVLLSNNNVHDNADNGLGLSGLKGGAGANLIANNTVSNNGRFGIEIKNPSGNGSTTGDGSIYLDNNTVSLIPTVGMNNRDHAGIAIFRRAFQPGNPDGYVNIPTGVVLKNNTIDGFKHLNPGRVESEGFGIVIEGTNNEVNTNTIKNSDIGIQEQGGGHPNSNYVSDNAGDGDQVDSKSANYFGRGNAPVACGNEIVGNSFISNGLNQRTSGPGAGANGFVTNINTLETFCSIQAAINDAQTLDGHTLEVYSGIYNEQVLVNKTLTIKGVGATQPIVDFTGIVSGKPSLFDISANGVSIENINFKVDLAKLKSAIIATNSNLDLITIKDNLIDPYGPPSAGTYGDRNAVSVNYGGPTNYRVATGGVNVVNFLNNIVTAGTYPTMFRAGIAADEVGGLFNGNTLTTINHDIILRFGSNGNITISNNTISGGGVELTEQNAGAGQIDVIGNNFDATWANGLAPYSPILRLKNNYTFRPTLVDNNIFTNHQWGISLENYNTVTINNNSFTPLAGSTTYNHITINTKEFSSSSGFYPPNVDATITNNTFNNSGVLGGIALVFNNHDNDSPVFGNFAISSNNFMDNIATVIKLDNQSGPTMAPVTIMAPWTKDLDASNNSYDVGSGIKLPAVMSNTELYKLEDRIQHAIDIPGLGFVTVKLANSYVTTNSFVSPTTTSPSVQRGINELASLGTVNVEAGNNYTGGADATASGFDITLSPGASPACVTWSGNMLLNSGDILNVDINGTTACTLYDQFIVNGTVDLGGATLNINLGYVPANGDQIKIIDNDLVDVIVGQFAQGDYISSGGYAFTIDYFGGDGNDVVLTKCSGVINSNTSNVYCTIQDAINDPTTLNGHTLIVSAGLYAENIIVNKELIILGPNKDIDPCSGIRVGEANVVPAISGIASGEIFHIAASNVTISGLTIDGDNPYIVSGFTSTNGADIDAAEGITIYETGINNLTVSNNIIQNVSYSGITLYDYLFGLPSSGNEIKNNKIQDLGTYDISSGIVNYGLGILLYNNQYAHVADNCITNVRVGLQTGNFYLANPGALNNQLIENNSISARRRGIFHNLAYGTASEIKLNDNIISGISDVNETVWDGILFASLSVPCTATNNNVDGSAISNPSEGLEVWNVSTTSPTALIGGQIKGVNNGIFINNYEGYSSDANLGSNAIVEGVTVVPKSGGNGIWIYDSPSSSHVSVSATVQSDCEINQIDQSGTGILIQNSKASASIKDNVSSINGFLIGIDVDGGSATIEENHIYDNGIGVRFTNSGTGSVLTNKFFDALPNDKDLQATNSADAVLASPNNWFGGTSFGVENLSGPLNIDATLNYWNSASGPGLIAAGSGAKLTNFVSYCQWIGDAPVFWGGTGLPLSSPIVNITIDENSGINDDGIICNGATVDLDASTLGASSYQWSTMETTTGISVTPNMTTTYTVTVTFNDCQVVASQTITVNQLPACNINGLNLVCPNSSNIYSTAPGYTSYEWSIIGDGSISGPSNLESVLIIANNSCNGSYTLNLIITDINGCSSNCSLIVTVQDLVAPSLTGVAYPGTTGTNACLSNAVISAPFSAANAIQGYTDNCGSAVTASLTGTLVSGTNCGWTVTYTFSIIDSCGNTLTNQSYSNTGSDQTAPSLTGVPFPGTTGTNACLSNAVSSAPFNPVNARQGYTDNCGSPVRDGLTGTLVTGTNCGWTVTYTFSVIDSCGNVLTNQSYSNSGSDQTAPSLTGVPYPGTTGTNACLSNAVISAPFSAVNAIQGYSDNCGSAVTASLTNTSVSGTNCGWTVTYTFSIIDSCGNALLNRTYSNTGSDQTAPSLTGVPFPGTTGTNACLSNAISSAPFSAVSARQGYTDNCGSPIRAILTGTLLTGTNCGWTVTYTFSIIDSCGNTLPNRTYSNTGSDQTAPSLTGVPYPGTTGTNACLNNAVISAPFNAVNARQGYTDNCGSAVTASLTGTLVTGTNCGWTVTYTFSIIDSCGNALTNRTYSNTGRDQTAPSLTGVPYPGTTGTNACLTNAVISAPFSPANAIQGYTDNCGSAVTANLIGTLVTGTKCGWTITYRFSIIDSCGNTLTNRSYSNTGSDQTAPSLTGPAYPGTTGTNACLSNAVSSAPFNAVNAIQGYTDNCGGAVTASLTGTLVTGTNCGWTVTYTFSIIDSCGNAFTNRTYSNTGSDQTAPSLTGAAYLGTIGNNGCLSNATSSAPFSAANAIQGYTDNCGSAVTASLTGTLVTGTNCGWNVTYTFSIIDSCGNALTNQTYSNTGSDQTAPSLTGAAYTGTTGTNACLINAVSSAPFSAANAIQGYTDNCGSAVTASLTGTLVSGTNCGWTVTYTFSIIDSCGNTLTNQSYSNTGSDQTAPSLTGAAYLGTSGTNACLSNAVSSAPFSAANAIQGYTDNCGSAVTASL